MPILNSKLVQNNFKKRSSLKLTTIFSRVQTPEYLIQFDKLNTYQGGFGFDNGNQIEECNSGKIFFNLNYELLYPLNNDYYRTPYISLEKNTSNQVIELNVNNKILSSANELKKIKKEIKISLEQLEIVSSNDNLITGTWSNTNSKTLEEKNILKYQTIKIQYTGNAVNNNYETIEIRKGNQVLGKLAFFFRELIKVKILPLFCVKTNEKTVEFKNFNKITSTDGFSKSKIRQTFNDFNKVGLSQCQVNAELIEDYSFPHDIPKTISSDEKKIRDYTKEEIRDAVDEITTLIKNLDSKTFVFIFWPYSTKQTEENVGGFSAYGRGNIYIKSIIGAKYAYDTYTHEFGHRMGVKHTFKEKNVLQNIVRLTATLFRYLRNLDLVKDEDFQQYGDYLNNQSYSILEVYESTITPLLKKMLSEEVTKKFFQNLQRNDFSLLDEYILQLYSLITYRQEGTNNFMDYSSNKNEFYRYQWDIIRNKLNQ